MGASLSKEEETQNMVLYTTAGDPHTYEEAEKNHQ